MEHCISNDQVTILFSAEKSIEAFFHHIDKVIASGAKSVFLLSANENHFNEAQINQKLKQLSIPVCGGIFPQIIFQDEAYENGSIVCGFHFEIQVSHIHHLSDSNSSFNQALESTAQQFKNNKNMMVLIDGNNPCLSKFLEKLYCYFGGETTYFGGGAGTLQLVPMPCLYSNEGLLVDTAQLVGIQSNMQVAVEHGWEKLAGPFLITESHQHIIQMIDYHPAFDCYKSVIEENSDHRFDHESFFDISKYFPFGIEKLDGSIIVRDPIKHVDSALVCIGEVPRNSIVYILKGSDQKLIAAAEKAATHIQYADPLMPLILFNCISLLLVLNKQHTEELKALVDHLPAHACLIGASSIGEIASNSNGLLEFYNKSVVLASFVEKSIC